jgi:threonine/homoserine/homoserine lactone efflux protein
MAINFVPFFVATLTISLTPGMAMFYCIHSTLQRGRRAGVAAAIGVELGVFAYVLITVFGLSKLITASPLLYAALKVVGSLYLCYLAYASFPKGKGRAAPHAQGKTIANENKLLGGFLLNVMNPKILIFFLTLLPQFVPLESRDGQTFLLLGLLFNLSGLIVNAAVAYFSPQISKLFRTESPVLTALQYVPPFVFFGTAIYGVSDLLKLL